MNHPRTKEQKHQITIQEITGNPLSIMSEFYLKDGEKIIFRPLVRNDYAAFGFFLDSLSEETRKKYGPHPLNSEEAKNICDNLNYSEMLRIVLINSKEEIVGYMILSFQFRDSQLLRYEDYKIPIVKGRDACIAPVIADRYQNKGVGSILLQKTLELAKSLGVGQIILWQGTQVTNTRAIHFYEKFGFKKIGEFERYGTNNCDMYLNLQ